MGAMIAAETKGPQCMYISMGYLLSDTLTKIIGSKDYFYIL